MRETGLGRLAGDVDDAAALALADHPAGGVLGTQKRSLEVHVQDRVPLVFRQFGAGGYQVADPGVVHQDVQAPEALDGVRHRGLDLGLVAHVKRECVRDSAPVPDALHHGLHGIRGSNVPVGHVFVRRLPKVRDHYAGAAFGQLGGDAFAEPAGAAGSGNERNLAAQIVVLHGADFSR